MSSLIPATSSTTPFANRPLQSFQQSTESILMRSMNERDILDRVRSLSATTRAELVLATGLTAQSIMRLVDDMQAAGLLRFGPSISKGRGKPSPQVELVADYAYSLGISIATDSITLALIDFSGRLICQNRVVMPVIQRSLLIKHVESTLAGMLQTYKVDRARLFGIGIGMTGYFVGEGSKLNPAAELDDLALVEIDQLFAQAFDLPVWLDNDGNVAAIGESLLGVGSWAKNFAYLYIAHGLGGGIIVDGRCMRGSHGNAGEFAGMLPMLGMERATLELLRNMLTEDGIHLASIQALIDSFDPTWPAIERWINKVSPGLSLIASAITAIIDPDAIVLGGRIPGALAERLIPHITIDNISRRSMARPQPKLVSAKAPIDATAIGAATLPFKECFFR